ncbi:MAG: hypothetical protein SFU56_09525 [Capsulimonadales bacterium]|nr:hypothetical protein [Capsulimonadales bacterium]
MLWEDGMLIAYVSGHGLGHSTREIEILRHLPPEIPLTVKTVAPERFWRTELARSFDLVAEAFDVGCVQRNGIDIDVSATLAAWNAVAARNRERIATEVADLRERNARLILTDVPSFPLTVAAALDIPSVCVANFTWADIYRAFAAEEPGFAAIADELTEEYAKATLHLEPGFSLSMPFFPCTLSVGVVARPGVDRRDELLAFLPPEARERRIALVYVGGWGLPIEYERVTAFPDWHFLSLDPPPIVPGNWTVLSRERMAHPDLVASVDAVISKPGYGICGECLRAGTPLLYPPRPAFAEYRALHATLSVWPGGILLTPEAFSTVMWRAALDAVSPRGAIPPERTDGGPRAARTLTETYRETVSS